MFRSENIPVRDLIEDLPVGNLIAWGILVPPINGKSFNYTKSLPNGLVNHKYSQYGALFTNERNQTGQVLIFPHKTSYLLPGSDTVGGAINLSQAIQSIPKLSEEEVINFIKMFRFYLEKHGMKRDEIQISLHYFSYSYTKFEKETNYKPQNGKSKFIQKFIQSNQHYYPDKLYGEPGPKGVSVPKYKMN